MKINKTMTAKAIAANQRNAQSSSGPKDMTSVRNNALKHGLLARRVVFQTDEEKAEFQAIFDELRREFEPSGAIAEMLVEEVAVCWWKLSAALGWEAQELQNRHEATKAVFQALDQSDGRGPVLLHQVDDSCSGHFGLECSELVVRSGTKTLNEEDDASGDEKSKKSGNLQLEAKLTVATETLLRYQSTTKRDFYRALEMLERYRHGKSN